MTTYDKPLGEPPPRYPGLVRAVRKNGTIVQPPNCIGKADELTFDVAVFRVGGQLNLVGVPSDEIPPPHNVDINCNEHHGGWVDVWYVPQLRKYVVRVPLNEDSEECA